ncbi:hypothetical protein T440DRAFT_497198 [Plenodomus tracheiphilus IPT5]|uniref:Uncharacterized protein n=1 Tax=Plenodomus tracheiphilus IPT5 TaxID=1408161 RepID=A0A6A7BFI1_9PLEO|nr:hypothetical protein T440DRAFT_497198 [Plenodomus tracheiphilus IPT5]
MKLFYTFFPLLSGVSALPSVEVQAIRSVTALNDDPSPVKNCQPGMKYCLNQIISDLGVDMQNILHQYCETQYTFDALSCHACKKFPVPLPECGAAPAAWNSIFTCNSGQTYDFAVRCENWCEAGECV